MKKVTYMTNVDDVTKVLNELSQHDLAQKWLYNDLVKKNLAESYDYWLETTNIPMTLKEHVQQYLNHAHLLGGIFSPD
jgi:hypothetical protein